MTNEELVKAKWPDAEISKAFVVQRDQSRRWMYCVMSTLKFLASRGKKQHRVVNVGGWHFCVADAWADAANVATKPEQAKG